MLAKKNSRTKNSILNITTSFGGQILSTILNFVVRTVFIYTLGKSYLGINGLFSNILTMLSLTELGFDTAINFKLYKPLAEGDEKRVRVLMKFYKSAYRLIGLVILVLGLLMIPLLPVLIKDYDSLKTIGINAVLIFILHLLRSVSSYLFFAYRSAIIKADQRKYILDIVGYGFTVLTCILKILVLVIWKNFVLYTATVIFVNIVQNLVNAIISQRYYPNVFIKEKDRISKEEVIGLLKDCGALAVFKLNGVVLKVTDNFVISAFINLATVGLYSNYVLFYGTMKSLFNKVFSSLKASMGNLFVTESVEKKYSFFEITNYMSIILFGTAFIGIAVCADEFVKLWIGADYIIPQPFAALIGLEVLFYGLKVNLNQIRHVSGVFRQMWMRPIIGIIINVAVSVILVQFIGICGIILGTICADFFANFMVDPMIIHKHTFNNYKPVSAYYKRNLMYLLVLLIIGFADYFICTNVLTGLGWFSLIAHVLFVGISVPGVIMLLFWRTRENQYVLSMIKRILAKRGARRAKS